MILVAACGDDGGAHKLPDAPPFDAPGGDAPIDAPMIDAPVMITTNPVIATGLGSLCGVAFDAVDNEVLVYPCSNASIYRRGTDGAALGTIARPGEAADDVDLEVATVAFTLGTTNVTAGALLFGNGESGTLDVYVPEVSATAALVTQFGASHIVGTAHHPGRGTLFAVQDRVAGSAGNMIAEIDTVTGAIVNSFSTLPAFDVNYGDIEVCPSSGSLFLVSSIETTVAEMTPAGMLVAEYPLPAEVVGASGIGLEGDAAGSAWISDTNGGLWRISGLPCVP